MHNNDETVSASYVVTSFGKRGINSRRPGDISYEDTYTASNLRIEDQREKLNKEMGINTNQTESKSSSYSKSQTYIATV